MKDTVDMLQDGYYFSHGRLYCYIEVLYISQSPFKVEVKWHSLNTFHASMSCQCEASANLLLHLVFQNLSFF